MDAFNMAPQPKTFAPSREDVLQTLSYFFGAPVSPEKLKNYEEHHATTYHFPDACEPARRNPTPNPQPQPQPPSHL